MYKFCEKICHDCPFSKTSVPGALADYKVHDFVTLQNKEFPMPCHLHLEEDLTLEEAKLLVLNGTLPVCRGFAESMLMSCKMPRDHEFATALQTLTISGDALNIFEFIKHHNEKEI
jgi:hypothetical protein